MLVEISGVIRNPLPCMERSCGKEKAKSDIRCRYPGEKISRAEKGLLGRGGKAAQEAKKKRKNNGEGPSEGAKDSIASFRKREALTLIK